jgi:adenine-specific DNA-methyltransferase
MARIDDLVSQIRDKGLRQKLEGALADMKRRQRFGLVFEEHVPETSALLRYPVVVGATVQRRTDPDDGVYRVTFANGRDRLTIEPEEGGKPETASAKELMVVKRFGDPIFPALTSLGAVRRGPPDKPHHAVINGENFHALQLLVYLYEGRVDCIYIDPPYNTGARDWKYNNRYVDNKDAWRHSKWLSMMEKRLRLARRLLKPDGVLIVTIDEHEVHHLGMLLERVFPEYLRHMVSIVINPKGTGKLNFGRVDEYAIFCVPDVGKVSVIQGAPTAPAKQADAAPAEALGDEDEEEDDGEEEDDESDGEDEAGAAAKLPFPKEQIDLWELRHARRRGGESGYRHQRPNQFYPIYVDPKTSQVVRTGPSIKAGQKPDFSPVKGLRPVWPIDREGNDRCWRLVSERMQALIDAGRVVTGRYNPEQEMWTINIWVPKAASKKLKTVWWDSAHDAGTHGTTLLHKLLGQRGAFPFPKSVYAVKDCLAAVVRNRPEALILDFFAGSGTTFHATCLLNAEDSGSRRSVLVTNNEVAEKTARRLRKHGLYPGDSAFEKYGIFSQATRPRCEAVVTGKRPDGEKIAGTHIGGRPFAQGFEENVEFFGLDYLDPDDVDLGNQFDAIFPALWLAAEGIGDRRKVDRDRDMLVPPSGKYAVLFREEKFRKFSKLIEGRPEVRYVWIVTDSEDAFAEMRSNLSPRLVTSMLYRDYLRNFRINTRHNL